MNKLKSAITKLWWKPYSFIRGNKVVQTRDQTITHLVFFYLLSISIACLLGAIQVSGMPDKWNIPVPKEIVGTLSSLILVKLGWDFIRDFIAAEFDAGTRNIEKEVTDKFQQKIQELQVEIKNLQSRESLDKNYLSYLQQSLGDDNFKLQGVNQELQSQYSEDRSGFNEKLKKGFKNSKDTRKARCIIHDLNDRFLQQLAIQGIIDGLDLTFEDVRERTKTGNDLHRLRVDIYAYLSAWLICSIDNDLGLTMSIQPIGMRYMKGNNVPDKETYKKIIQAIQKAILSDEYKKLHDYPESNPLASDIVKNTIVSYLEQLIVLVDNYSYREIAKS